MLRGQGQGATAWTDVVRPDGGSPDIATEAGRQGLDQPPQRLGAGRRGPAVVAAVIATALGIALWQPWAPSRMPAASSPAPVIALRAADTATIEPSPAEAPRAPVSVPSAAPVTAGTAFYTTITDNEWTVVALLAAGATGSTDEPATQHPADKPWSPDGPWLVLQQGLTPVAEPIVATAESPGPCPPASVPRDRTAVPLPAGRVAYLGITVPAGVPRPQVTARRLGGAQDELARVPNPAVRLAGLDAATRYIIPTAGPGAAILFASAAPAPLAPGAYEFTVASPQASGERYLYACIAP
jgi:hypothetical protein